MKYMRREIMVVQKMRRVRIRLKRKRGLFGGLELELDMSCKRILAMKRVGSN